MLAQGSVILPGNWGRLIRAYGWQHALALREMALEDTRRSRFPHRPSRLDSAFVFLSIAEAQDFRSQNGGFLKHILYRVTLCEPDAACHIADTRLCGPHGLTRPDWADAYWMDLESQASAIPEIDWIAFTNGTPQREMLTLSKLLVEERLD